MTSSFPTVLQLLNALHQSSMKLLASKSNLVAGRWQLLLAKIFGTHFVSSDQDGSVYFITYKGKVYFMGFDQPNQVFTWSKFDHFIGMVRNFLAFVGFVSACIALALYQVGFFEIK